MFRAIKDKKLFERKITVHPRWTNFWRPLLALLAGVLLGVSAQATITDFQISAVNTASGLADYVPGQSNTLDFTVIYYTPDGEYMDNVVFTFPAGVTVTGVAGRSPWAGCRGGAANSSFTTSTASWLAPGHRTYCGGFPTGTYPGFVVTVNVDSGFTGPLTVFAHAEGDGRLGPIGNTNANTTLSPSSPPAALRLTCPADGSARLVVGQSTAAVYYPDPVLTASPGVTGASFSCTPASGSQFGVGSTPVTCTATGTDNGATLTASCTFQVDVDEPPVAVPTTSARVLVALSLLLIGGAALRLRRR